jgi:hypothetical protein
MRPVDSLGGPRSREEIFVNLQRPDRVQSRSCIPSQPGGRAGGSVAPSSALAQGGLDHFFLLGGKLS